MQVYVCRVEPLYAGHFACMHEDCMEKSLHVVQRFHYSEVILYMHSNLSGPTKAVCYREVCAIRSLVCYKNFHLISP